VAVVQESVEHAAVVQYVVDLDDPLRQPVTFDGA
jgi:hypothetical protein